MSSNATTRRETQNMTNSLEIIKFKRLLKKAVEDQYNKTIDFRSDIRVSDNMQRRMAYTELSTQNEDDMLYGIAKSGKTNNNGDLILYRYMYNIEELNNNLYYIELKDGKVFKIKYLDNFLFHKELVKIRKLLAWENNYLLMDITKFICGDYGDADMNSYYSYGFTNTEGFIDGPTKKNKGYNWDSYNDCIKDE